MSDNITVRGFVASEIRSSTTPGGVATASFRLGSTERRYDRTSSTWIDGNTNWFTVQGYRQLAGNIGCSIKKGQRVIVVGRLKMRSWEKDGRIYHVAEIDAESVGHDLMWGSANFTRMVSVGSQSAAAQPATAAADDDTDPGQLPPGDGQDNDGGEASHTVFVDDASGEVEEVDEETGELKGVAA
ncbi:single-stranded DNA-binding protein [Pseudarthrobacter albicanus]|uniref:single-stranded DNA-binding protein n=1 Tax=Pseudarthrobacter albicanus TaxID=2823873 RepID=UPI001BA4DFDD|nr:single-stranded DNA-binding protein [Pseudarthrobacter albicanus]